MMKMNKNKPHFKVTFQINMDATSHKVIDVWATTEKMALKKAEMMIRQDKTVFQSHRTNIEKV